MVGLAHSWARTDGTPLDQKVKSAGSGIRLFLEDMGMRELVEYLVKSLVDHPEDVLVEETREDNMVALELRVAADDLGKVIGKHGNTVNAIRNVLQAAATSRKLRAKLEVVGATDLSSTPDHEVLE
jgi:uncharacterized protein